MRDPTKPTSPGARPAPPAAAPVEKPATPPPAPAIAATPVAAAAPPTARSAAALGTAFTRPSPLAGHSAPPKAAPAATATVTAAINPDSMKTGAAAALGALERSGTFIGGLGVGGLRLLMPMLSAYSDKNPDDTGASDPPKNPNGTPHLTRRENAIITAAAGKALLELLEITSRTDPIMPGEAPYVAYDDGVFRPPHLMHLLSLASAANRVLGSKGDDSTDGDNDLPPTIDATHSVAYVAIAPGEYARESGPLTPTAIRRSAMRERTYNAPPLAMLARSSNKFKTAPATGGTGGSVAMMHATGGANYNSQAYGAQASNAHPSGGCGCGGSCGGSCGSPATSTCGCSSCGSPATYQFSPARRDAEGKCVSIFNISCDAGWRLRECLKFSLCEFIRCVGDEVCDDGKFAPSPDLKSCLEGMVCTLLTCLPEAICPTPPPVKYCPPTLPCNDDCNYASGRR